jgi:predicted small lipoprotein YifL
LHAHNAQKIMRESVLLLILAVMLTACGLKGPLYLPQQKPAANPPAAEPAANLPAVEKKNPGSQ